MARLSKKQLSKLGLAALAMISIAERRRKKRNSMSASRLWARPHIMARNLPVLCEREPSQFRASFFARPVTTFDWLLNMSDVTSEPCF